MADATEDRYRRQYMELVDELDHREREWAETERRLQRLLAQLLILAEGGADPDSAVALREAREELQSGLDVGALEARLEPLKKRVLRETRWAEQPPEFPPVHQILIHLVERLPLPPDLADRAVSVIESLEAGIPPDGLPEAIENVSNLVYRVRANMQEEKRELEALLKEVTGHLKEIDGGLAAAHEQARAGFASSRSLDAAVRAEVQDLEESSEAAADVEALQHAVRTTLRSIRQHMEAKEEEDQLREQQLSSEVERLRRTITDLEEQVEVYREKTQQAREMSLKDPLTGCYNRLAYMERAAAEEARWQRYGAPLSLLVLDLDRFKSINDTFGHRAGDQVLRTVAQIAGNQLRQVDFFGRYGGEEFVVLLPETSLAAALTVAEKIRAAVENFRFHSRGARVPVTVSSGAAQLRTGDTLAGAFERADRALYLAKNSGRNRCCGQDDLEADA